MKAAVWYGPGDLRIETLPEPSFTPDDMLVSVLACNICGSDLRTFVSGSRSIPPGTVLGHEFAGRVLQAPPGSGFVPGDLVTAAQDTPCGECWYCTHGMEHVCENKLEFGKHFQGAFAERMVIPSLVLRKGWVRKVPGDLSLDAASLIEPLSSCVHAHNLVPTRPGDLVVIIGAGPIGCMHGQLAKHFGGRVVLTDLSATRLELARRFSFDAYVQAPHEDLAEVVRRLAPQGADKVISANPSPAAILQGVDLVRKGGHVIAFGGLPVDNHSVAVDGNRVHYDEIHLVGSYAYSRDENDQALDLIRQGVISAEQYITVRYPLEELAQAMETARQASQLKVQIRFN